MTTKYLRYTDLVERQIVNNRTTLARWIRDNGFPPGVLLGPNTRAWPVDQVDTWLEARAAEREVA
ncbi:MAG: AlpA family phage regulatory protein [Proteobacteria bacterium]|nr:AlpA family phage regulatory protein [Pseudomonadota bacterium]